MNADSFFTQGAGHTICQDHATTRETERFTMAVVCDGCSSSPKSEVGAGVLAHVFAESVIQTAAWVDEERQRSGDAETASSIVLKANIQHRLREISRLTGLPCHTFDATIVAAVADAEREELELFMWGDGHIHVVFANGDEVLYSARYDSNAPYYFSYQLEAARPALYLKEFGSNKATLTTHRIGDTPTERQIEPYYSWKLKFSEVQRVTLFSDGLETFTKGTETGNAEISIVELLPNVAKYKMTDGEYITRRLTRFLKECKRDGVTHFDDFGSAGIIL